jgi:hypothetical protein
MDDSGKPMGRGGDRFRTLSLLPVLRRGRSGFAAEFLLLGATSYKPSSLKAG